MAFHYVIQELRHHHHRTVINVLGIAVGIGLFVAINAVATAYQEALRLPFRNVGADLVLQKPEIKRENTEIGKVSMQGVRLPFSNQMIASSDIDKIDKIEGFSAKATSLLLWEFSPDGFKTVMGVDPEQPGLGPVKVKDWIVEGRFLEGKNEVILEKHYAKFRNLRVNDSISIGSRSFKVVGLLAIKEGAQIAAANTFMSIGDARSIFSEDTGAVNLLFVRLKDPSMQEDFKSYVEKTLPAMSVISADSSLEVMGGISKISNQFAFILSGVALIGAILLIVRSMVANLMTRANQIGILKALGWTSKDVHRQIMGEAMIQSLTGGVFGLIVGYLLAYMLANVPVSVAGPAQMSQMPSVARNSEMALSSTVTLPIHLSAELVLASLLVSIFSGLLAGYLMGRRTDRMKPADIMREF